MEENGFETRLISESADLSVATVTAGAVDTEDAGNPCRERAYEVCICEAVPREPGVGRQMVQGRNPEEPRDISSNRYGSGV